MTFLHDPAWQNLFANVIQPLVLSLGAAGVAWLWAWLKPRLPQALADHLDQLATMAVQKAEQLATRAVNPIDPDQRKAIAIKDIEAILAKEHLLQHVSPNAIDAAVEAAVLLLPSSFPLLNVPPSLAPALANAPAAAAPNVPVTTLATVGTYDGTNMRLYAAPNMPVTTLATSVFVDPQPTMARPVLDNATVAATATSATALPTSPAAA